MTRAAIAVSVMVAASGSALANNAPPPGAILDLNGSPLIGADYRPFSTTFVATTARTLISFAFQDDPGYIGFDNASVSSGGGANLLSNPGFETGNTSGWTTFHQAGTMNDGFVTTSFAGLTAASGSYFWVDGATNGYDGLQQTIATTIGATYTISFDLAQIEQINVNSALFSSLVTNACAGVDGDAIDTLVYAQPLPDPPAPVSEPGALFLLASGLSCVWLTTRSRDRSRQVPAPARFAFLPDRRYATLQKINVRSRFN
jgi:hypothetical protein